MPVVERDIVLPVTRERAWELITEPAELEEWLADEVEFEAEEGALLHVVWREGEGESTIRDGAARERVVERIGVVERVEPAERVVFRWGASESGESRVEWRLDDHPDGTRFVVTEHRFVDDGVVWGPALSAMRATASLALA